jgi:hypothetical protein
MNQTNPPTEKPQQGKIVQQASLFAVGGEVGCLTLIIVFAAVFGGLYLDNLLGTKPVLTILFVLGSAPLALALTFWVAMRAVKRYSPPQPTASAQPGKIYDEEENSE